MSEALIKLNEALSKDYLEMTVHDTAHVILPKNLPIKLTVGGIKSIVHVGEFAIIPPGNAFAINSSPERYCLDFDFEIISSNEEFNIIYPIVSRPGIYHPVTADDGFYGTTTWYTGEICGETPPMSNFMIPHPFKLDFSPVALLTELAERLISNNGHFPNSLATAKLYELFAGLGEEIIFRGFNGKQETAASAPSLINLGKTIGFIHENYSKELDLEAVSSVAGYSRTHYSKLFKEFYKLSFYDYLTDVRVRMAGIMLRTTDKSIAEIGEGAGFSSSSTFNRVFKQETGYSPREYRKL